MSLNPSFRNDERGFEMLGDRVERVRDRAGRRGEIDLHRDRGVQNFVGEPPDIIGHGRPEEQGLPLGRNVPDNLPNIRQKAHIKHPVRLVQYEHFQEGAFPGYLQFDNIDRPGAFWARFSIKADLVTFGKALKTIALDGRMVDKSFTSVVIGNKAKSFAAVKPFYSSLGHFFYLLIHNIKSQKVSPKKRPQSQKSLWPL